MSSATRRKNSAADDAGTVPPMCTLHSSIPAAVKVPRGEHSARYLCHNCLRDERPILFVSLRLPTDPRNIR